MRISERTLYILIGVLAAPIVWFYARLVVLLWRALPEYQGTLPSDR